MIFKSAKSLSPNFSQCFFFTATTNVLSTDVVESYWFSELICFDLQTLHLAPFELHNNYLIGRIIVYKHICDILKLKFGPKQKYSRTHLTPKKLTLKLA